MDTLFIAWLVMLVYAAVRPLRRAWIEQSAIAALAFGLLPVLNAATSDLGLARSLPAREWTLAGFDLTAFAFGLGFLVVVWQLRRADASARSSAARYASSTITEGPTVIELGQAQPTPCDFASAE